MVAWPQDEPVLQKTDRDCGLAVTAWIAKCMNVAATTEQIQAWIETRRWDVTHWKTSEPFGGTLEWEPALWFEEHGFETGVLRIPIARQKTLESQAEAAFLAALALVSTGFIRGWYVCRGIARPESPDHLRAIAYDRIMDPRLGMLPLTLENFHRMPTPGPIAQSWTLFYVKEST